MTRSRLPLAALALILMSPVYAHAQQATTPATDAVAIQDPATFPGGELLSPAEKQQFQDQMKSAQNAQERQQLTRALRETIKTRIQEKKDLLGVPNTPDAAQKAAMNQEKQAKSKSRFGRGASIYGERASHGGSGEGSGSGSGGGSGNSNGGGHDRSGGGHDRSGGGHDGGMR